MGFLLCTCVGLMVDQVVRRPMPVATRFVHGTPCAVKLAENLLAGAHPTTSSVTHIRLVAQTGQMVQNFLAASMRIRRGSKGWQQYRRESGTMHRSFEAMCAAGVARALIQFGPR
jgi:hypothetical protein